MDRIIAPGTVTLAAADRAPATGTPGLATDGNAAAGTQPTLWPAYGWNMLSEEVRGVIIAAGLTPDGTNWTQLLEAIAILSKPSLAFYGNAGSFVYSVDPSVYWLDIIVVGGGGGGSECQTSSGASGDQSGGGGGGGGLSLGQFAVTPGSQIPIIVGAGGATQANGGVSSAGTLLSATGGSGSSFQNGVNSCPGGGGGSGLGPQLNLSGSWGSDGQSLTGLFAGNGAPGLWGFGAGRAGSLAGVAGSAPGAGGGGAYDFTNGGKGGGTVCPGGAGAPGCVIIKELRAPA